MAVAADPVALEVAEVLVAPVAPVVAELDEVVAAADDEEDDEATVPCRTWNVPDCAKMPLCPLDVDGARLMA